MILHDLDWDNTMIKGLLTNISVDLFKSEDRTGNLMKYAKMREQPGWKVHQMLMVAIANKMSEHMLSKEFTKLSAEDMKTNQRAFYYTKEIIDFLIDPLKVAKQLAKIALHNEKMGATIGQPQRKP